MYRRASGKSSFTLFPFVFLSVFSLSACDIVQGFRDAGNAIFPEEKTYLDAPGFRMLEGGYRHLEATAGTDIYLIARSSDPSDSSLYAMRYADPKPCPIPNVARHYLSQGFFLGPAIIAYYASGDATGTLRFADATCRTYDFTVPGSSLPVLEMPQGFVLIAGGDLILVDPVAGSTKLLVREVEGLWGSAFGEFNVVQSEGRLGAFRNDWTEGGWFGSGVVAAGSAGQSFFFEDAAGIHRLTSSGGSNPTVIEDVIAQSACNLGFSSGLGAYETWVMYDSPCEGGKLVAYGEQSRKASELAVPADPHHVALMPAWPNGDGDPASDPFFIFYLTEVDDGTGLGTLVMRSPDGVDHTLGAKAPLDRVTIIESAAETHGYALVDVDGNTGRYARWNADGTLEELAQNVLRGTNDLVINFDGQTGDFALPSAQGLTVVAHRVPSAFKFRDPKGRWTALLHDYDGTVATLSITKSSLDFSEAAHSPGAPPELETIAHGVRPGYRAQFLSNLPGIAYLTDYDPASDTGRLEYRNLELGFTATVSDGVSDYLSTLDSLIYAVPFSQSEGIWLVRAR